MTHNTIHAAETVAWFATGDDSYYYEPMLYDCGPPFVWLGFVVRGYKRR